MNFSELPAHVQARMKPPAPKPATKAKGQTRKPKTQNKGECAYDRHLMARLDVAWHQFEGITLKLGPDCRLTPDFVIMRPDGSLECHDVKGRKGDSYWAEEDAMIKIRTAAAMYPFRFFIVWLDSRGVWQKKEIIP